MTARQSIETLLYVRSRSTDTSIGRRHGEPVTAGIPLPQGVCVETEHVRILDADAHAVPVQLSILERWPDSSIRWLLVDLSVESPATYRLQLNPQAIESVAPAVPIRIRRQAQRPIVETGTATFAIGSGNCLFEVTRPDGTRPPVRITLVATDRHHQPAMVRFDRVAEETTGPLRTTLLVSGTVEFGPAICNMSARLHFFSASSVVRAEVLVVNPRRSAHPSNFWELGDPNSVLFRDLSVRIECPAPISSGLCVLQPGGAPVLVSAPASIYQESSGGENWRSTVHVNRDGEIPNRFRGFRFDAGDTRVEGGRATPVLIGDYAGGRVAAAVRYFWQNFPKAIEIDGSELTVRLFPRQFPDLHELQGGEQKTHVLGLAFGEDPIEAPALSWVLEPSVVSTGPEWYARAEVVPYLTPTARSKEPAYEALVAAAIDGHDTFEHKRERIDEYGWRNFGDLYADHEAVGHQGEQLLVSHYNNQYDAIAGLAIQFMRSGDLRWWSAMEELVAHVTDIDIYHTYEDKTAYNGGLFWHTAHYIDAGRSTHRTYPRKPGAPSGGPSNEQNYTTGLLLHFLLTGHQPSRETVTQLAEWVLAMDDGRRTVFRWLTVADTGLASSTASVLFHGPGRGAANSIATLLNAYRLTGEFKLLEKAQSLIRRCIHPADDIDARNLLDAERRWSYTVFLQLLGRYLDDKLLLKQVDEQYAYARASLLHYVRWMAAHEYPYLDRPEILEYPTETWAAQDMRKSEVFAMAARHVSGHERESFLERSDFFFRTSTRTLLASATRTLTRPVVLMLSYGYAVAALRRTTVAFEELAERDFGAVTSFTPQRVIAGRRARAFGLLGLALLVLVLGWIVMAAG